MPKLRTLAQNKIIHSLLNTWGFDSESKSELVLDITKGRTESTKELTFAEANFMIEKLKGSKPEPGQSIRNIQHRRASAGVPTIVTPTHLDEMRRLWRSVETRTDAGLEALTQRIIKKPRPLTAQECNKVIEAIKSMNKRAKEAAKTAAVEPKEVA